MASAKSKAASQHTPLVSELAQYLAAPPNEGQPVIIRSPFIKNEKKQHVIVIWDKWKGIAFKDRSLILIEANDLLDADQKAEVVFAIGRTVEEAISLGYFPYRIEALLRDSEQPLRSQIEQVMRREGAIDSRDGLQLRFTKLEDAQEAFTRLYAQLPGPYWSIIEEVSRDN